MTQPKPILVTSTGELTQLVRVYYQVFKPKTVLGVFKKLRCMDFDPNRDRWVWLFDNEAKKLRFGKPYNQLDKAMRPVVIGSFYWRGDDQLILDVLSVERATGAIAFFDKRINQRAAKVSYLRVLNRLFESTQESAQALMQQSPDDFFDREGIIRAGDALLAEMERLKAEYPDSEMRRNMALAWIEQHAQAPTPEIEEIPPNFYEDGIQGLEMSFRLRQLELIERWQGNQNANVLSIIQRSLDP